MYVQDGYQYAYFIFLYTLNNIGLYLLRRALKITCNMRDECNMREFVAYFCLLYL